MPRPGVTITSRAARAARGNPTFSGVAFIAGFAQRGPHGVPRKITSLDEFVQNYGERVSYSGLYDWLDTFFNEGGATAQVSRVVGVAPTVASRTLVDRAGVPVNTLRIDAVDVGDWASTGTTALTVSVENGALANTYTLIIRQNGVEVERFADLATPAAAVTALATSRYVRAVDLASATAAPNNNPAVAANLALTGGTDDRGTAVDAHWSTAIGAFARDLGPGQVATPDRTTAAWHALLIEHARTRNRTAYLDAPDLSSRAALVALADAAGLVNGAEYAGLFGSWVNVPGLTGGSSRAVPGSALAAGLTGRLDAQLGTAGGAPAGGQGQADWALSVRQPTVPFVDADYEALNNAGVNMIRQFTNLGVRLYGFRSVSDNPDWQQLTANRLRVSLVARLEAEAERFVFRTIDGQGHLFSELQGALTGILLSDFNAGALYGAAPEDAFRVDVGDTVNTPTTIAAGEIRANVNARFSPFAELVSVSIIKVPVTGRV